MPQSIPRCTHHWSPKQGVHLKEKSAKTPGFIPCHSTPACAGHRSVDPQGKGTVQQTPGCPQPLTHLRPTLLVKHQQPYTHDRHWEVWGSPVQGLPLPNFIPAVTHPHTFIPSHTLHSHTPHTSHSLTQSQTPTSLTLTQTSHTLIHRHWRLTLTY